MIKKAINAVKSAFQRAKLPRNYKAAVSSVTAYRQLRAAGKIDKISSMEKLSQFVGKKGGLLKEKVRSSAGKQRFSEAVAAVKKEIGRRPGKKTLLRYQKAKQEQRQKATQTYVQKQVPDKRFKKKAREMASRYNKMIDTFASETWNKLRDGGYGVGSDIVEALVDEGMSADEISEYLEQVMETLNDIPSEARAMATDDDFWKSVVELTEAIKDNDILSVPDVFEAYLTTEPENREYFEAALQNYIELGNNSQPFSEVWEVLQQSIDPASMDNMEEILGEEE